MPLSLWTPRKKFPQEIGDKTFEMEIILRGEGWSREGVIFIWRYGLGEAVVVAQSRRSKREKAVIGRGFQTVIISPKNVVNYWSMAILSNNKNQYSYKLTYIQRWSKRHVRFRNVGYSAAISSACTETANRPFTLVSSTILATGTNLFVRLCIWVSVNWILPFDLRGVWPVL